MQYVHTLDYSILRFVAVISVEELIMTCNSMQENTFQAILITDGIYSYTILSYKCGLLEWDGAVVGFKADGDFFENVDPDVDCLNSPKSEYSNLIFLLSNESPEIPLPGIFPYETLHVVL